jgi:hypothetical protein
MAKMGEFRFSERNVRKSRQIRQRQLGAKAFPSVSIFAICEQWLFIGRAAGAMPIATNHSLAQKFW